MPADEKAKRVMTRIGVWTPGRQCEGAIAFASSSNPDAMCLCGRKGIKGPYDDGMHDIPCPDPSDPAMLNAMLEWVVRRFQVTFGPLDETYEENYFCQICDEGQEIHAHQLGTTKTLALIDAIDALPEEVRNG